MVLMSSKCSHPASFRVVYPARLGVFATLDSWGQYG